MMHGTGPQVEKPCFREKRPRASWDGKASGLRGGLKWLPCVQDDLFLDTCAAFSAPFGSSHRAIVLPATALLFTVPVPPAPPPIRAGGQFLWPVDSDAEKTSYLLFCSRSAHSFRGVRKSMHMLYVTFFLLLMHSSTAVLATTH